MKDQFINHNIIRVEKGEFKEVDERVAVEEPLELRLAGETIATTMRTPGHDAYLAQGFFFSEGLIQRISQVGRVYHCGRPGDVTFGNTIDITPAPGVMLDFKSKPGTRRGTLIHSACGVCGREQIEDLLKRCQPFNEIIQVKAQLIQTCLRKMASEQRLFGYTGGVHAAGSFTDSGNKLCVFEDVGRHNATDKAIGELFEKDLIGEGSILTVSGRISFEIVQKAAISRHRAIIGISAPTSLAVNLAESLNIALIGFVRENRWSYFTR